MSLVSRFAGRWKQVLFGVVTAFLLLPLPGLAFTFAGNWTLDSKTGDVNWFEDGSHNLFITTSTTGPRTDNFTITQTNTVTILNGTSLQGLATYGYTLGDIPYDSYSLSLRQNTTTYFTGNFSQETGTASNQFTTDASRNYVVTVTFEITANGGSWYSSQTTLTNLTFQ